MTNWFAFHLKKLLSWMASNGYGCDSPPRRMPLDPIVAQQIQCVADDGCGGWIPARGNGRSINHWLLAGS